MFRKIFNFKNNSSPLTLSGRSHPRPTRVISLAALALLIQTTLAISTQAANFAFLDEVKKFWGIGEASIGKMGVISSSARAVPKKSGQGLDPLTPTAIVPFTAGNIVVCRVGAGVNSLGTEATAVFLDEYTPSGTLVQQIPLPTAVSGANKRLTLSGSAISECQITRSFDGRYLLVTGYDANTGTLSISGSSTSSSPVLRVIGRVDSVGNIDTSTTTTNFSGKSIRGATSSNGSDIYAVGESNGSVYLPFGGSGSGTILNSDPSNLRSINIFNNQLYCSTGSGTSNRLFSVGTGLPTSSGQALTNVPGTTASQPSDPYAFSFSSVNTVYVTNGSTVRKYSGGAQLGSVALSAVLGLTTRSVAGAVEVYASTGSGIYKLTDSSGDAGTLTSTFGAAISVSGPNKAFRGVAFVPKTTPTLSVTNTPVTYSGSAQTVIVAASVPGNVNNVKYNSSTVAPTNAGTYAITVDFTPTDTGTYASLTAASAGNFVISKATATVAFAPAPTPNFPGSDFAMSATTSNTDSGNLTYSYVSGPCSFVSGATFRPTGPGTCVIKADGAATANFNAASNSVSILIALTQYTITANAGSNGSISPAGAVLVDHGADQAFAITADPGYHIADVSTDAGSLGTVGSYTFTGVTADHSITATFAANSISGRVTYENAATGTVYVSGVNISAQGTPSVSDTTDGSGAYSLSGFGPAAYTVTPSKPDEVDAIAVTAGDAAKVARFVVGLDTPTDAQLRAAKVTGSFTPALSSYDAALIAQYVVGIHNPINQTGRWKFRNAAGDPFTYYPSVNIDFSSQDYAAILLGDVTGGWPTGSRAEPVDANSEGTKNAVRASLPNSEAGQGSVVTVPFSLGNLQGRSIDSYQFNIEYDPTVLEPIANSASGLGTLSEGLAVVSNAPQPGLLKVAVYGVVPVTGDGVYVNLRFRTIGSVGSTSPHNIDRFRFNDGTADHTIVNGRFTVTAASASASVHGRLLTAGGQGVRNARVVLTSTSGASFSALTGAFGYYEFSGLAVGETYTVSVEARRYTFSPRTISVTANATELDMIADQ